MKEKLIGLSKLIGAVTVIVTTTLLFDNAFDAQAQRDAAVLDSMGSMMEQINYINVEQQFLSEDVVKLVDTMSAFRVEQQAHHEAIENLGWAVRNQDNFTPEQMEEIMDRMFRKNAWGWYGSDFIGALPPYVQPPSAE